MLKGLRSGQSCEKSIDEPVQSESVFAELLTRYWAMKYVISVKMVNVDTKEEEIFYKRESRDRCQFKEWFAYKNYRIQLRLDYNGNLNEAPTLDADIDDTITGEHLPKGTWHHAEAKHNATSNTNIYTFKFAGLELRLSIITTWAMGFGVDAIIGKPQGS